MLEGYTTLGYFAGLTQRVKLGTLVTGVIYRQPGLLIKEVTTLDVLSGGRMYLGIGAAWYEREARGLGFGFPPLKERFERLEETLQIAHQMWSPNNGPFNGKHYQLAETICTPQPLQQPHPPILIGGSGEKKTLRTVAKYADLWNAMGTVDVMRHKVEVLQQHCDAVGRDISEIEFTLGAKPIIRDSQADAVAYWTANMERNKTPMSEVADDDTFWNGTPEQIAERLVPYVELGFRHILVEMPAPFDQETLERLIGEVKPLIERG